ncbi:uncharacterized protein LOC143593135 [Bidens hawaiensis]|uniref:uncharacterized protein LOC143593135 n=1 Tax=Bidens hawaiensis TaxID=980011 RepID=UPI004049F8D7
MLISSKVNGSYEAKDEVMESYLEQARQLIQKFKSCKVKRIKRSENKSADTLRKLAATSFEHLAKEIRVEKPAEPSVSPRQEKVEAQKIRHKALQYQMKKGILYRRSFLGPLLRCVDADDANYFIREIHEGICGLHAVPRMAVAKITNAGYYSPGMHTNVVKELMKCDSCQRHASNTLIPKNDLIPVSAAWPFQKRAIDIMGPFPEAP